MATIQLPSLPAASSTTSGDLMHLRQGLVDKKMDVDVLKAFLTSGNGAGSGLDADLLDGQHGSFYQNANNLNAGTVPLARMPDFSASITSNGHITIPGGLILQWGSVSYAAQQVAKHTIATFPIPFPTAALQVIMSPSSDIDTGINAYLIDAVPGPATTTQFLGHVTGFTTGHEHDGFSWMAIGH